MTENPTTPFSEQSSEPSQMESARARPLQNFLLGAFFGAIPVGVALDMSAYMTHTPLAEFGILKLAIAATIPISIGILSVILKGKFVKALGDVLSTTIV
ncbi:MAG: hypothetical protein AAFN12_13365 [Cyanobacteria bacterium J06560_2]